MNCDGVFSNLTIERLSYSGVCIVYLLHLCVLELRITGSEFRFAKVNFRRLNNIILSLYLMDDKIEISFYSETLDAAK